jgi:uncharacterized protein
MAVNPTYPGVYIEEIASGVHTIVGGATSITAFLGQAKFGPVDSAVHIFSFRDYERNFGGIDGLAMGYAVSQFFLNGGTEAYIVRLAKNAAAAFANVLDANGNVLAITALAQGNAGNNIQLVITPTPPNASKDNIGNFDLTLNYVSVDNPANNVTEGYQNLSLNSADPRFVGDLINDISRLITVAVIASIPASAFSAPIEQAPAHEGIISGTFTDIELTNLKTLPDATHNSFKIGFDGHPADTVVIHGGPGDGSNLADYLKKMAKRIQDEVQALHPDRPAWSNFTCDSDGSHLILSSGTRGLAGAVAVTAADPKSIVHEFHLDATTAKPTTSLALTNGGITSGAFDPTQFATIKNSLDATHNSFKIGFNGNAPVNTVKIDDSAINAADLPAYLKEVATRITQAVQAINPNVPAWKGFICTADDTHLILTSGTTGGSSAVKVAAADPNNILSNLHLDTTTPNVPNIPSLSGGAGDKFDESTNPAALQIYTGDAVQRTGIQALEAVDLFNLLCLPGIAQPGILTMALQYCQQRRAVLIVDSPPGLKPQDMVAQITGPNLPKGDLGTYAAIYYPWLKAPDVLKGKLQTFPPSGVIAGLYARTDATRGVWKAPAGTDATLIGVQGMDYLLNDAENGSLNPHGVNCLRIFPVFGAVSWGARTVSGDDQIGSDYKYVPVRRTALFIEESLYRGLKWAVFEPNDEPLWASIRLNAGAFMHELFIKGAFQGSTPRDAYFVKCDKETTTQNDINLGIVNVLIGFAPLKPAEFVIVQLQQIAGQIQV